MSSRSFPGRSRGRRAAAYVAAGGALLAFGLGCAVVVAAVSRAELAAVSASPFNALVAPFHFGLTLTGRLP